jgi:CheY-like chemotaxis protein
MTASRPDRHDRSAGARPRVLVVDDDDAVCELLRQALTDEGYAVATVPHGAAALELVRHHQPAVILVDLRMPIMDGWAFVDQYRRIADPPASIVLLSALKDIEQNAKWLGAAGFIAKPFEISEVVSVVGRCVSEREGEVAL